MPIDPKMSVIQWNYVDVDGLPEEPSTISQCRNYLVATVESEIETLEFVNGQWFDDFGNETSYTVYAWAEVAPPCFPTPGYRCPHCYVDVTVQVVETEGEMCDWMSTSFVCPKCGKLVSVTIVPEMVLVEAALE